MTRSCWWCRLPRYRVHARPVVVGSGGRRRGHVHRLATASRSGKRRYLVRPRRRVGCRDRRVGRAVVAQCRGRRGSVSSVPHRRRQGERRPSGWSAVAHRRCRHHQVRMALRLRHSDLHVDRHRCRAVVVGGVGLAPSTASSQRTRRSSDVGPAGLAAAGAVTWSTAVAAAPRGRKSATASVPTSVSSSDTSVGPSRRSSGSSAASSPPRPHPQGSAPSPAG